MAGDLPKCGFKVSGDGVRKPGVNLRLVNLPGYSPDFNADEAIWGWVREEATGTCAWEPGPWCGRG